MNTVIGKHSGVPIVTIDSYEGDTEAAPEYVRECPACGSPRILVQHTRQPICNLEPTVGKPYPTFDTDWWDNYDYRCANCGCCWGDHIPGERCEPEYLPYDLLTHLRLDELTAQDYLG